MKLVHDADAAEEATSFEESLKVARSYSRICQKLNISNDDAAEAISKKLVGGVMPSINLASLEALASVVGARVKVTIEPREGEPIDLAFL